MLFLRVINVSIKNQLRIKNLLFHNLRFFFVDHEKNRTKTIFWARILRNVIAQSIYRFFWKNNDLTTRWNHKNFQIISIKIYASDKIESKKRKLDTSYTTIIDLTKQKKYYELNNTLKIFSLNCEMFIKKITSTSRHCLHENIFSIRCIILLKISKIVVWILANCIMILNKISINESLISRRIKNRSKSILKHYFKMFLKIIFLINYNQNYIITSL